jgi:hypothetical protein
MGDLENPNADEAVADAPAEDAPQDPVQAAKDEAWLAQFRADNAAKVVAYDGTSNVETQAELAGDLARRDFDMNLADTISKDAARARTEAAALDKKAQQDASRHDEYAAQAEIDRHTADAEDASAAHLRSEAAQLDATATKLTTELHDEMKILREHQREYELIQQQAVAAQRIADNEAKLSHPGDPAPDDAGGKPPTP